MAAPVCCCKVCHTLCGNMCHGHAAVTGTDCGLQRLHLGVSKDDVTKMPTNKAAALARSLHWCQERHTPGAGHRGHARASVDVDSCWRGNGVAWPQAPRVTA